MTAHVCRFCEDFAKPLRIRSDRDAAEFFYCQGIRFPPLLTRLSGLVTQLDRAARSYTDAL